MHMDTDSEVTGLPKTEYHKTDKTFSAPGKSRHIACHLLAHNSYKLAVEQSFSSNPKSLYEAFTIILTHSIQLMEVFLSRFCFVVLERFCVFLVWFFNIKGSLLKFWLPGCQQHRQQGVPCAPHNLLFQSRVGGLPFQELSLKLPEVKLQDNFRYGYDFYPNC